MSDNNAVQNKRIFLYDNLKLILMLMVIIGHLCLPYVDSDLPYIHGFGVFRFCYSFIYLFHMPLFIFVAGHFHSDRRVLSRCLSFVIMWFVLKCFKTILYSLIYRYYIGFSITDENNITWYMLAMAVWTLLGYLLKDADKRICLVISLILACAAGYFNFIGDFLAISRIIVFFPFYLLGMIVSSDNVLKASRSKRLKIIAVIIILIWILVCVLYYDKIMSFVSLFKGNASYKMIFGTESVIYKSHTGALIRLLYYMAALLLGFSIIVLVPDVKLPMVSSIGQRTLQIYFWHEPVITIIRRILYVNSDYTLWFISGGYSILWLLSGIILLFVLSLRIFSFPTDNIIKVCRNAEEGNRK